LASYKSQVRMADKIANVLLDQLLQKYGTSVSELKRNADSLWDYWNTPPNEETH
jgi:hypothetical protein